MLVSARLHEVVACRLPPLLSARRIGSIETQTSEARRAGQKSLSLEGERVTSLIKSWSESDRSVCSDADVYWYIEQVNMKLVLRFDTQVVLHGNRADVEVICAWLLRTPLLGAEYDGNQIKGV